MLLDNENKSMYFDNIGGYGFNNFIEQSRTFLKKNGFNIVLEKGK